MNTKFLTQIKSDFGDFHFKAGKKFAFRPPRTIIIGPEEPYDSLLLLHELGHALSLHRDFNTDAKRLKMELEAWDKARELADKYEIPFNEDLMESQLETYRNWLDVKSKCPICGLTRYQTQNGDYHCPVCENFS